MRDSGRWRAAREGFEVLDLAAGLTSSRRGVRIQGVLAGRLDTSPPHS